MHSHILVIDDSSAALLLYQELLAPLNAEIKIARNGAEGLAMAQEDRFDLILTDVDMPQMNGIELCRALHADPRTVDIPVIIASTFDTDRDIIKGFEAGATAYLSKLELRDFLGKTVRDVLWRNDQVRRRTVLIVDDSHTILTLIKETLEQAGFRALTAENGVAALDVMARIKPDLILSDINMPEMDGFELCWELKVDPKWASIPFVVMSTNSEKAYMKRMLQYGAAAYLTKPFNLDQLVVSIEKILSDHFLQLLQERERLKQERTGLLSSIESLVTALEARDLYTKGHSDAVAKISSEMVALSGASQADVERVELGGRLHDIGKIGIRDEVLLKPGRLTEEEFEHIKQHPLIGKKIVESVPSFADLLPIILSHHERWDGKGYPEGLKGEEIPRWARITAVADTFHALVSDRPYRRGMDYERAFDIIRSTCGTQHCPDSVELFFRWVDSKNGVVPLF